MTGRYRHLTQAVGPVTELGLAAPRPVEQPAFGSVHLRTFMFLVVALLVGGGLLSIVPDLSASAVQANAPVTTAVESSSPPASAPQTGQVDSSAPASASLAPATAPDPGRAISPVFTREVQHWAPKIVEWSDRYGLDPDIVATIMQIESCGDPGAMSHAGAQGLFQVMPFHFAPGEDMLDPDTNAMRGMAFYNRQLEYTGQDVYLSFAGYNGGYAASGSSYAYWANETQRYFTWAKGIFDDAATGLSDSPTLQQWLAAGGSSLCQSAAQRLGI